MIKADTSNTLSSESSKRKPKTMVLITQQQGDSGSAASGSSESSGSKNPKEGGQRKSSSHGGKKKSEMQDKKGHEHTTKHQSKNGTSKKKGHSDKRNPKNNEEQQPVIEMSDPLNKQVEGIQNNNNAATKREKRHSISGQNKDPDYHWQKDPDYHWESHGGSSKRQSSKNEKEKQRRKSASASASSGTHEKIKRFSLLKDDDLEDDVFDVELDEEEIGGEMSNSSTRNNKFSPKMEARKELIQQWDTEEHRMREEEEQEEDEKELDKAEDLALQTSARTSPTPADSLVAPALRPASPKRPSRGGGAGPESPKSSRLSLHSLGSPVPSATGHSSASFIPPFMVETDEDDDDEDEEGLGGSRKRDLIRRDSHHKNGVGSDHHLHGSVSSTSSGEWEWPTQEAIPEAMGLDEGIPQINQKRCSSIL